MTPHDRKAEILDAAVRVSRALGYTRITKDAVAEGAGCSPSLIMHYYPTMARLRRAVMSHAVHTCDLRLIAQGLVARDAKAHRAPQDLRERALASML